MSTLRKYGVGALFSTALIDGAGDPPGLTFAAPTLVAGDLKRSTDLLALGNLTAEYGAFTSGGTSIPAVGDTLTGATSSQTCVVIGYKLTSGTWAGGDAAGYIFVEQVSGAFSSENLNNTTQSVSNQLTLTADFTPSIGGLAISDEIWLALTSAEMTCRQGMVLIEDQAATVWAADGIAFETFGHANAAIVLDLSGINPIPADMRTIEGSDASDIFDGLSADHATTQAAIAALNDISAADVWAAATRTLTAGTNIVLAKGTGVTGFNDLDAAGVRTAVGLAAANLDTQLGAIVADTNELQQDWVNGGRLDLLIDAILADTAELQADWVDGGRLDLILDSRASQSSVNTIDDLLDTEIAQILSELAVVDSNVDAILLDTGTDGVTLTAAAIDAIHDEPITEPTSRPAWASMTHRKIQQVLGVMMLNEVNSDGDSVDFRNDADTLTLWSFPSSDDGSIYTSGKAA